MFAASKTDSASDGGYQISRSLRFNSADSAYLNRTPASASNRRTFTISKWVKRAALGTLQYLWEGGSPDGQTTRLLCRFNTDDTLRVATGSTIVFNTTQVFRDPSSWYHIVVAIDTPNATQASRARLYVNGSEVTAFSSASYFGSNDDTGWNMAQAHSIGRSHVDSAGYLSAYLTEFYNVDGTALTPSSFGETNAQTGVWQPKAYSGSYGTNGFYLNFSDNSNTTAATLGKDYSGNGNNWTPNNFSVTAGAGNDSLVDSPTSYGTDTGVGGTVRGNYCTLNPLATGSGKVLVNGNLEFTSSTSNWYFSLGTIGFSSGKYYWEVNMGSTNGSDMFAGIMGSGVPVNGANGLQDNVTALNTFGSLLFCDDGKYQLDGNTGRVAYSTALTSNQTLGIAVDMDTKSLTFYKDNVSQGAISFSSSPMASSIVCPSFSSYATGDSNRVFNFGQRPFAYTAPSGFKALCTQNLPTPTIGATTATQAGKFFNPVLYTGNGTTQTISGVGFQPDLVWCKGRSNAFWHSWIDAVRGRGFASFSNTTNAEFTSPVGKELTAFTSDGFNLGPDDGFSINSSGSTFVSWNWKANGSGSSNTVGSITSTVSANTTSGFSIATYTGNGTAGATIGHGIGVAPSMIIIKNRSTSSYDWMAYNTNIGNTKYLRFNQADAAATSSSAFNNTSPTSTVFSLGDGSLGNQSTYTYVAYCFAPIAGYSAFGSYTGNGSTGGPFVYCGFRPAFVIIKNTTNANDWMMFDSARNAYNATNLYLQPNQSSVEASGIGDGVDFLSNGLKIKSTNPTVNASTDVYIFMCFASNPFKYSLAR